jgi:hypothetical protein
MALPYYLVDNPLTPDPNDFRAELELQGCKYLKDIVDRILKNNVGISESELLAVLDQEQKAIKEFLENGYKVDTGMVVIRPTIKGVFHSATEVFTKGKHELRIRITPKSALKAVLDKLTLVKVVGSKATPVIVAFDDMISKTRNSTVTPGKTAKIFGDKLKFDGEDTEQGIFFINNKGVATRVAEYVETGIKKLIFNIPQGLPKGNYTLEVRTKTSAGGLRTSEPAGPLTV